jgi:uncharacterized protein (TIGR00255 family)
MIRSMTAFARHEFTDDWGNLSWELRTVNHRYLDISLRLPEEMRRLETKVRETVGRFLQRGKLDCNLRYQPSGTGGAEFTLNEDLAKRISHVSRKVDGMLYNPSPVSSMEVLKWPGVLEAESPDLEQLQQKALTLLETALAELIETREREGARLKELLVQRCEAMQKAAATIQDRMPQVLSIFRERLLARFDEIREQLDENRVEQEMVIVAQKLDISEELDRMETHVQEVLRVLDKGGAVGRRLDFLMQELNREANTIASKSIDSDVTQAAVELKVLIEQAREQVQNIE